jgi:hypothetical protein
VPEDEELPISAIRLTAESTAGRRNRIGTLLAEPVLRDAADDEEERPESD